MKTKILCILILCMTIIGCTQSTASLLPFIDQTASGKTDLEGKTYYIVSDVSPAETTHDTFFSYGANTQNYDSAIQRFNDVQKKLNCKLEFAVPVGSRDMLLAAAAEKRIPAVLYNFYKYIGQQLKAVLG